MDKLDKSRKPYLRDRADRRIMSRTEQLQDRIDKLIDCALRHDLLAERVGQKEVMLFNGQHQLGRVIIDRRHGAGSEFCYRLNRIGNKSTRSPSTVIRWALALHSHKA